VAFQQAAQLTPPCHTLRQGRRQIAGFIYLASIRLWFLHFVKSF